jgi:hypothetical protein
VAHALDEWELLAYAIAFSQCENGGLEWDWDNMKFKDKDEL